MMRLADFVIIGPAKSGTNTLKHYLRRHPRIFIAPGEPSFYSYFLDRGIHWYQAKFEQASDGQLWGDCSTSYSMDRFAGRASELIARSRPDTKLIFLMRHPVE